MKNNLLTLLILSFYSTFLFSQKGEVLVTDFRYIVYDTQEFPNYFNIESLSNEVFEACTAQLRSKLNVLNIDTYQAKEIEYTFRPPFRDNIDLVDKKEYDYYTAITSSIGANTTSTGERTYVLYMKVQIENEAGKSIFHNKTQAEFQLNYKPDALYDEAIISSQDFKVLYLELLAATLDNKKTVIKRFFNKPTISAYKGFLNKANQYKILRKTSTFNERFYIETAEGTDLIFKFNKKLLSLEGSLTLGEAYLNYTFTKRFTLRNKQNKRKYRINSHYEEVFVRDKNQKVITVPELTVNWKDGESSFTYFPEPDSKWISTLKGKVNDLEFNLIANLYTNHVEVLTNGHIIAIIKLPPNDPFKELPQKYYDFYLKKGLNAELKHNLTTVFALFTMADLFMDDVHRFVSKRDKNTEEDK